MQSVLRYFDLASDLRTRRSEVKGPSTKKSFHWIPQYLALIFGVIIQPFFSVYQQTGHWNFVGFSGRLLFAVIVGLAVFPAVYKGAFDREKPMFVQLCAIFAAGMGWESLLRTALKASGV